MARELIPGDATIKAVQPGDARKRLNDGSGLYLLLFVKGGAHGWRLDYRIGGLRKTLSLGIYPDTDLALARVKADEARELVRAGIDPSDVRKEGKAATRRRRDVKTEAMTPEAFDSALVELGWKAVDFTHRTGLVPNAVWRWRRGLAQIPDWVPEYLRTCLELKLVRATLDVDRLHAVLSAMAQPCGVIPAGPARRSDAVDDEAAP